MENEKKRSKELFTVTSDNVWKIATVALAIVVIAFLARDFMGTESSVADIGGSAGTIDTGSAGNDIEFSDVELLDTDRIKGDVDAPVTIIEYSDFQCPYCQRFYSQTLSSVIENYVDTGKVKFVYRHFPLNFHQNAQIAGEGAECAGDQNMFWEMHDLLFDNGSGDGSGLARADIDGYAETLGLELDTFAECLDTGKYTDKVQTDMKIGASQGVSGTPGFLVDGVLISGAQPYTVFKQAIEAALAAKE